MTYTTGALAEGKTKRIFRSNEDPNVAVVVSKDDITAGDGKRHDVFPGFGRLSNLTTSNVFRLLKSSGIAVAFHDLIDDTSFAADLCKMILLEIVVRREAHGSYLKRFPFMSKGHLFPALVFELFLKTSGRKWKEHDLPCDDPLIDWKSEQGKIRLFLPDKPLWEQKEPFLVLDASEVPAFEKVAEIEGRARRVFLILEKAFQLQGIRLVDFKIEEGETADGRVLLSDVIDSSSWRIVGSDGKYIDKQAYRDGGDLEGVFKLFERGLAITDRFGLPQRQRIIVWTGSPDDDTSVIKKALTDFEGPELDVSYVALSGHKNTVQTCLKLQRMVQEVPDCVIIAFVGMSDGLAPILSANTSAQVFAVPATFDKFPDDTWSSLRMPSDVPLTTVLDPKNAVKAAIRTLASGNPRLYMLQQVKIEKRQVNVWEIPA